MPDAPKPTYNRHGALQTDWLVVVSYRAERDCYTLSWTKDGDAWHRTQQGALAYPVDDLPDLLEGVESRVQVLAGPRLF